MHSVIPLARILSRLSQIFRVHSDEELCEILVKCQLADTPFGANSMLSLDVGEAGRDISAGQRQLVCLARTLLRQPRPKVICFDEATASVDTKTEEAIHVCAKH